MPARESLARVRPVGPGRRFSARDPASPGVACSTLVPRRARLAGARRSVRAIRVSTPRHTGRQCPARGWMRPGGVGPPAYRAKPSDQRPSQRAPGPQPSESQRARGGRPTPSDAGLRPTLSQASSTAPQRPPGYRSRPRPAPPPLGAAALANTSVPSGSQAGHHATARVKQPLSSLAHMQGQR